MIINHNCCIKLVRLVSSIKCQQHCLVTLSEILRHFEEHFQARLLCFTNTIKLNVMCLHSAGLLR